MEPTGHDAPARLLERLDAIGHSLERTGRAVALLGLGSVGRETGRIDAWSDLDFFAIVQPGEKQRFLDSLDWLAAAHPIAWAFRNTVDGYKVLMADGIFCEMAVFELDELAAIPYSPGRVVWSIPGVESSIADPARPLPSRDRPDPGWLVGEALSNLFVGLGRWHRGERLAGSRLVQVHAVDRVLQLIGPGAPDGEAGSDPRSVDPFTPERRIEARRPDLADRLAACAQGVERTRESAIAVLDLLTELLDGGGAGGQAELVPLDVAAWIRALAAAEPGVVVPFPRAG